MVSLDSVWHLASGAWSAIATLVGVGIAAAAASVGWSQLREARKLRRAQAQPQVAVFTEESGGDPRHIDLVIKNLGRTTATAVQVAFSPAQLDSAVLRPEHSPIKLPEMIPVLVPGQEWRTFWDYTPRRDAAKDLPRQYHAVVKFNDAQDQHSYEYAFDIDWQPLIDRGFVTVYNMHDTARALREISKVLTDAQRSPMQAINVTSRDGDERDRALSEYYEQFDKPGEPES